MKSALLAAFTVLSVSACDNSQAIHKMSPGWERMQTQARAESYGETPVFADHRAMRTPPPGTMPQNALDVPGDDPDDGTNQIALGIGPETAAPERIPASITVDVPMIERGHQSFDSYCAACHGVRGDGESVVASKMQERRPPSLHDARIVHLSDGQIARVVRQGYGFMPPFASELDPMARWEVVAYVRALQATEIPATQLSQGARTQLDEGTP